jgi:predicted nucleic acid-binding protein
MRLESVVTDIFARSAVVIQELAAGTLDKSRLQGLDVLRRAHEKEGTLLVPTGEDWWLAGKLLNSFLRGLKSRSRGRTPQLPAGEKQRIIRDVLIARTVRRANALLVTDNAKDFSAIGRFCAVRTVGAADYFKG